MLRDWIEAPQRERVAKVVPPEDFDEGDLRLLRFAGHEALSEPFRYEVEVLSPRVDLPVETLLGKPLSVMLERPGAAFVPGDVPLGPRHFHGHVAAVEQIGMHGRHFGYRLSLRPWLWLLSRRVDCRIYQERSTPEIVADVFAAYAGIGRYEMRLSEQHAKRRYTVQYRESDLAFVSRLLEEDGIAYHFEHTRDAHTLVLVDALGPRMPVPGYATIRYASGDAPSVREREAVTSWMQGREIRPGRVILVDHDFKKPGVVVDGRRDDPRDHEHAQAELFDYPGRFFNDEAAEGPAGDGEQLGAARARIALERMEVEHRQVRGATNARGLSAGHLFRLEGHPRDDQNLEYLVTAVEHELEVPPPEGKEAPLGARYGARFTALDHAVPYRPSLATPRPVMPGPQTAVVVGPAESEVHTDDYGRVKLRFRWDRNPGEAGTPRSADDLTCWVRVASPWAGRTWGATFLPRVGQEVLVEFLDGNPDRPVVTGRLNNAAQMPTAFSATGSLPANHALAGFRSKELGAFGYNELLFDDTAGRLRAKLSSEHAKTQLNLGYLVHPRDGDAAEARGEGFELRTDAWGALRGAKGLLLSTDGRAQAVGGQLDRDELVVCLEEALKLARGLAEHAGSAQVSGADKASQTATTDAAKHFGGGSNAEEKLASGKPIIALSSPAGIAMASPAGITTASGEHTDIVASMNVQVASGQETHLHAGQGVRLFAHSGGVKSVAGKGANLIQAQHDDVVVNAEQSVNVTASKAHIVLQAEQHVTLVESGGAYIRIAGGNVEIGGPGRLVVKTASYTFTGPASASTTLPAFGAAGVARGFQAVFEGSDQVVPDLPFEVKDASGAVVDAGKTDAEGKSARLERENYDVFGFVKKPEPPTSS